MIQPPYGQPWLLYALLGSSLAMNLYMVLERPAPEPTATPAVEVDGTLPGDLESHQDVSVALASVAPTHTIGNRDIGNPDVGNHDVGNHDIAVDAAMDAATLAINSAPSFRPSVEVLAFTGEWETVEAVVEHSLARTFQNALGEQGNALSAVYARLFVWDIDLRRELRGGDRVSVAWRVEEDGQIVIGAAHLVSQKLGRTLTAYRWLVPGDAFAGYWREDGSEAARRLIAGPLHEYEQVTSLLQDRPSHRGMDFKAPEGTPVVASFPGKVLRTNWNTRANGNCVEVSFQDGTVAKYLHLSSVVVKPGDSVRAGEVLALSGNTGRSTAPHLHYEVWLGKKVLDPVDHHGTIRRTLPSGKRKAFEQVVAQMDTLLGEEVALR